MSFTLPTALAVYFTIWWVTLFAVLPLGVKSVHEDAQAAVAGADPGAPIAPRLLIKAALTTAISALVFGCLLVGMRFVEF